MDSRKSFHTSITQTYYGFILVKKVSGAAICGRFPVTKKECTIGRDNRCDIRILLNGVSAQHCTIYYIDDKVNIIFLCITQIYLKNFFKGLYS